MIERRLLLRSASLALLASACPPVLAKAKPDDRPLAALLLPLTGPSADLARSMQHAAALAQPPDATKNTLVVFDTGSTPDGAAAAAALAVKRGVPLIIGPLFGDQVAPVVEAARGVPVVALSNDAGPGSFVLGITPAQTVGAILGYVRSRGVRRVALVTGTTQWDVMAAAAARRQAADLGLTLTDFAPGVTPDAVLVTGDADALAATARSLQGSGVQLLGTYQALALSGSGLAAIDGAWLAAPDPDGFADFARRFETAYGNPPGLIAGLAYDAVGIARTLRASGHGRDGLTASAGFPGVTGAVRFRADGSATRELAILVAEGGGFRTVAHSQT
jgi:branched-chain amino acid transport system substrate-binding protein